MSGEILKLTGNRCRSAMEQQHQYQYQQKQMYSRNLDPQTGLEGKRAFRIGLRLPALLLFRLKCLSF